VVASKRWGGQFVAISVEKEKNRLVPASAGREASYADGPLPVSFRKAFLPRRQVGAWRGASKRQPSHGASGERIRAPLSRIPSAEAIAKRGFAPWGGSLKVGLVSL